MINKPNTFNTPVRNIVARVEVYEGSTLLHTFTKDDNIVEFSVERVGDTSGFYGYSIIHKLTLQLLDIKRELNFPTSNTIKVFIDNATFPDFYVSEMRRDEKTNKITIHAYDKINQTRKMDFT